MQTRPSSRASDAIDRIYAESLVREAGFVMPAHHCHSYYELFHVEKGACRFLVEDSIFDLNAGDFMLIPPQLLHYTRYLFGPCRRSTIFFRGADIDPDIRALLPHPDSFLSEAQVFHAPDAHREQISALIERMITERRLEDPYSPPLLKRYLGELLLLCCRVCVFLRDLPSDIHTTDRQIMLAARYITTHYNEDISMDDIASAAGFSANYLSRKFREAAGLGIHQYLVFIRLRHAALELISTKDTITEIAFRCGFSDSNYFKDAFKKHYGLSPRDYRKSSGSFPSPSL